MKKPKALILSGYGLNCEEETAYSFELAGAEAKIVHINDLISGEKKLDSFQILAFPGGFSYGDDTGAGNGFANRVKNNLWEKLLKFIRKDKLVIAICNGFQIVINLGLLPALEADYGKREAALTWNKKARYLVRWVDLKVKNQTPWLQGIDKLSLPIAHGEGKFYSPTSVLQKLKNKKSIALQYIKGEVCEYQNLEANPNGSLADIAGITDESDRILGLMPHPERAIFCHHLPHWPWLKEKYKRQGKKLLQFGPGLQIFKNGVRYFK